MTVANSSFFAKKCFNSQFHDNILYIPPIFGMVSKRRWVKPIKTALTSCTFPFWPLQTKDIITIIMVYRAFNGTEIFHLYHTIQYVLCRIIRHRQNLNIRTNDKRHYPDNTWASTMIFGNGSREDKLTFNYWMLTSKNVNNLLVSFRSLNVQ